MSRSIIARLAQRFDKTTDFQLSRRQMLKASMATSAGLLLSGPLFGFRLPVRSSSKRIVVVGGGFAGTACAHELLAAGYDVTIVEARNRVGGRILSFNDFVENRNVEGGGELIGSNHPTWVGYTEKFGLEFLDVTEADGEFPIVLNGEKLDNAAAEDLWEEIETACSLMDADAADINEDEPWKSPNAAELDQRTVLKWIDGLDVSAQCKHALSIVFMADNGVDPARQSYLGMLAMVKGGGLDKYWTESEVYRCKGGNDQLARKLAEPLFENGRVILNVAVEKIQLKGNNVAVVCRDGRTLECDDVVVAVPPSVWNKITFEPGLPGGLKVQMGSNFKYLAAVKSRFWRNESIAPDALSDGEINMTWEATDNQDPDTIDHPACFVAFSGGSSSEAARARDPQARKAQFAKEMEAFFPGFKEQFVNDRFMDWPGDRWAMASYSMPAPGEVTTVGPLLRQGVRDKIHFAGEHACYKFVGYMEGALNSGASLAQRLAIRDGVLEHAH